MKLDKDLYKEILDLCSEGKFYVKIGKNTKAVENYKKALELIPEPKSDWRASFWIYASIGDAYFFDCMYKESLEAMLKAFEFPEGPENPLVLLRIGECFYEMREFDKAENYLLKTYKIRNKKIFEDEDSKYFNLIQYDI